MTGDSEAPYRPVREPRTCRLTIRGLDYSVREWGPSAGPIMMMLHGGRDSSASFQFLVDAMKGEHRVIAPDWRGHGRTDWARGAYWHSDFLCDLAQLVSVLSPDAPVVLVGHSMGGNIAALFAGLRPTRVSKLVIIDSLGNVLEDSPVRMADKLDELLGSQSDFPKARHFGDIESLARRLMQGNKRLDWPRALFLAEIAAQRNPDGSVRWPHDPTFKRSCPSLHSVEEWGDVWARIPSRVLCLLSSDPRPHAADGHEKHVRQRVAYFSDIDVHRLANTGHSVHVDAPDQVAGLIETFLGSGLGHPAARRVSSESLREQP